MDFAALSFEQHQSFCHYGSLPTQNKLAVDLPRLSIAFYDIIDCFKVNTNRWNHFLLLCPVFFRVRIPLHPIVIRHIEMFDSPNVNKQWTVYEKLNDEERILHIFVQF